MKKKLLVALKSIAMRLIIVQILIIVSVITTYAKNANGQNALNQKISVNVTHTELKTVLEKVQNSVDAKFVFSPTLINVKRKLSFSIEDKTVADFLKEIIATL
jgi:type II secretory pathway component GspD/PulD (secretin)